MRRGFLFAVMVVLVAGLVIPSPGLAGSTVRRPGPTIGEFVTLAANAGGAVTPVATDQALRGLERLGIIVSDPEAPLSQGMLARIMGSLGWDVTTGTPGAPADATMAGAALSLVGSSSINPLRGIGTEIYPPPNAPGGCLFGGVDCMQCCARLHIPLQGCSRFCSAVVVSPSGPPG